MVLIRKKKKQSPEEIEAERAQGELRKSGIQDEFQAKGFELVTWAQDHKERIVLGLCGVAIAMLVWGGVSYFSSGANVSASSDYEAALNLLDESQGAQVDKAKQAKALKAFEAVSEQYAGSGVAKFADLYVGGIALENNDAKLAIAAYERVLKSASNDDLLHQLASIGLASAYDAAADPKKALETYESVLKSRVKIDEAMVLWQAQRLAKETGQDKKASDFALQLATRYEWSSYVNQAQILPSKLE